MIASLMASHIATGLIGMGVGFGLAVLVKGWARGRRRHWKGRGW